MCVRQTESPLRMSTDPFGVQCLSAVCFTVAAVLFTTTVKPKMSHFPQMASDSDRLLLRHAQPERGIVPATVTSLSLLATCCWLPSVPMLYSGASIPADQTIMHHCWLCAWHNTQPVKFLLKWARCWRVAQGGFWSLVSLFSVLSCSICSLHWLLVC